MCHHPHGSCAVSRRDFLGGSLSCGAFLMFGLAAASPAARRAFAASPAGEVVRSEPFARIERIAEGVWATIATPMEDTGRIAISNGGIVAGRNGVLVVEGLNSPAGGAWLTDTALTLTGRRPTHVVLTHYHADHSGGLAGHLGGSTPPTIIGTEITRQALVDRYGRTPDAPAEAPPGAMRLAPKIVLPDSIIVDLDRPTTIDLGGRTVALTPRMGHSPSDLTVTVDSPRVVWCGDLVFNGMFPYYGDATPSRLGAACNAMLRDPDTLYVPGHGSLADAEGLEPYLALLADVEAAARSAFDRGVPASDAWRSYELPAALGAWQKFRPDVFRFAFEAWERELKG